MSRALPQPRTVWRTPGSVCVCVRVCVCVCVCTSVYVYIHMTPSATNKVERPTHTAPTARVTSSLPQEVRRHHSTEGNAAGRGHLCRHLARRAYH